jgi:MinD superfamily P-loop ATPase
MIAIRLRDLIRPPQKVLVEAGVRNGMSVLDFGCGPGGFSMAAAGLVGPEGRVYSLDLHPLALECVWRAAERRDLKNVQAISANRMGRIPTESVDLALLYDVLHIQPDLSATRGILEAIHRVLKPKGVLSVSDHHLREPSLLSIVTGNGLFRLVRSTRWTFQFEKTEAGETPIRILAVASGKGGTGKTTVSVNVARMFGSDVQLVDCDVEEPNCHLFLKGSATVEETVTIPIPEVDESRCDGCGECGRFCAYHAIVSFGTKPLVFPELCHGCGGCAKVCPKKAIREVDKRIGVIETHQAENITLIQGRLDVGVAMAPPLIRAVKSRLRNGVPAILDAPPGTSCPVIATLRGVDFVVLVTEPTPFGLHDLKLAVDMVRKLGMPFGVVVNRVGISDNRVHAYCAEENVPVLLEIPDDRRIAEVYSRGNLIVDALPEYRGLFQSLIEKTMNLKHSEASVPARKP